MIDTMRDALWDVANSELFKLYEQSLPYIILPLNYNHFPFSKGFDFMIKMLLSYLVLRLYF